MARHRFYATDEFSLGRYSLLIGWTAFVWLFLASITLLMPMRTNRIDGIWSVDNFNYTILVVAFTLAVALVYWNLPRPYGAKYFFRGPIRLEDDPDAARLRRESIRFVSKSFKHK